MAAVLIIAGLFSPVRRLSHQIAPYAPELQSDSAVGRLATDSLAAVEDENRFQDSLKGKSLDDVLDEEPGFGELVDIEVLGEGQTRTRSLDVPPIKTNLEAEKLIKPEGVHPEGEYFLQMGSYPDLEQAEKIVRELEDLNLPGRLLLPWRGEDQYYRVVVYRHPSRAGAEKRAEQLKTQRRIETEIVFMAGPN